jgi:tRNA nucleotidyltransferase/poly(A) polymerase
MELSKTNQKLLKDFLTGAEAAGVLDWAKKLMKEDPKAEIFLVGGAVRDCLLKKETKDFDFVVRGISAKKLEKFLSNLGSVDLVGKSFGVFKFVPREWKNKDIKLDALDIALPRTEKSILHSGAYRDFKIQSNYRLPIKDDLSRRDFTINAMAVKLNDIKNFELIDEFNGLDDLKNKIIKTVGKPEERFQEDYSRMLRGIRISCQLNFELENKTKKAIKKLMTKINDKIENGNKKGEYIIAREIVAKEFLRSLFENPVRAFDLFDELNVFKALMPEILKMKKCPQPKNYHSEGSVWNHTKLCLKMLDSKLFQNRFKTPISLPIENKLARIKCYDSEVALAVLLHDIAKPTTFKWGVKNGKKKMQYYEHDALGGKMAEEICERLKFSAPEKFGIDAKNVRWLIEKHMLIVGGKVAEMRQTKLEKYFLSDFFPGERLLQVIFCDAIGTIPYGKKIPQKNSDLKKWISLEGFDIFLKRIKAIKKMAGNINVRPAPILNGREVMKILNLEPGKIIGEILESLREAQLNGKVKNQTQAVEFIKGIKA